MKTGKVKFRLRSASPVLFCHYHNTPEQDGEIPADYEKRTWKGRCHFDDKDNVIIPGYMFQKALHAAGDFTGERVGGGKKGKGLKNFIATVRVEGHIKTNIKKNKMQGHTAFVSATGKEGGPRVPRTYPQINKWEGILTFVYPDLGVLNNSIIKKYLEIAGTAIGIGHWRPGSPSRGQYGLFIVS